MSAVLTVVVCCYNGADGLARVLTAIDRQTIRSQLEVIVVDDGSTDATTAVATRGGVQLLRHLENQGLAAGRNTGWQAAGTDLVAFTDDDCEPDPTWARELLAAAHRHPDAAGVGGQVVPVAGGSFVQRYLARSNPLAPLELGLTADHSLPYRLGQYLLRSARTSTPSGEREVGSLVGANMALRRGALQAIGGFDPRFRHGGEEEDAFRRLVVDQRRSVVFAPRAVVRHHFAPDLRDTLRRSRVTGRGNARMFLKHPGLTPTIYPAPIVLLLAALAAPKYPRAAALSAVLVPQLLFSRWPRQALRTPEALLYPYLQVAQEAANNLGWLEGRRREAAAFRRPRTGHDGLSHGVSDLRLGRPA